MDVVHLLLLALIIGMGVVLGQALFRYSLNGFVVVVATGFIGFLVSGFLARKLGLPKLLLVELGGRRFPIVWAVLGAVLLAVAAGLIWRRTRRV